MTKRFRPWMSSLFRSSLRFDSWLGWEALIRSETSARMTNYALQFKFVICPFSARAFVSFTRFENGMTIFLWLFVWVDSIMASFSNFSGTSCCLEVVGHSVIQDDSLTYLSLLAIHSFVVYLCFITSEIWLSNGFQLLTCRHWKILHDTPIKTASQDEKSATTIL